MAQIIDLHTRRTEEARPPENTRTVYPEAVDLYFNVPPRIGNRSDALELLDDLIRADYVQ
jgi:hypothetical protein